MLTRRDLMKSLAALPFLGWLKPAEATPLTIYNVWNTSEIGNPMRVFDADGVEHKNCYEVIVETGQITKAVVDKYGMVVVDHQIAKQTVIAPAPLRVVPVNSVRQALTQLVEYQQQQRTIVGPKITRLEERVA